MPNTASLVSVRLSRSLPPLPWPWPTASALTSLDGSHVLIAPRVLAPPVAPRQGSAAQAVALPCKVQPQALPAPEHSHSQDCWLTDRNFEVSLLLRRELLHVHNLRKFWMHKIHDFVSKEWSTKFCLRVSSRESDIVKFFKGAVLMAKSFDPVRFEYTAHHAHCVKNH